MVVANNLKVILNIKVSFSIHTDSLSVGLRARILLESKMIYSMFLILLKT